MFLNAKQTLYSAADYKAYFEQQKKQEIDELTQFNELHTIPFSSVVIDRSKVLGRG